MRDHKYVKLGLSKSRKLLLCNCFFVIEMKGTSSIISRMLIPDKIFANVGHEWWQLSDKSMQDLSDSQGAKSGLDVTPASCPGFEAVRNLQN